MEWKQRLALATGVLMSMSGGAVTATECSTSIRANNRLRLRRTTVPILVDPTTDNSIRANIRVPYPHNKLRTNNIRVQKGNEVRARRTCNDYRVRASLVNFARRTDSGSFFKVEIEGLVALGGATTLVFNILDEGEAGDNLTEEALLSPATVAVNVEVEPINEQNCASADIVSSFILTSQDGKRTYLPSQKLNSIKLNVDGFGDPGGPIIIEK